MANTNLKKAQKIVNDIDSELGISLVAYEVAELELLRDKITDLLELEVDVDLLHDADDDDFLDDESESDDDAPFDDEDEEEQE